MAGLMLGIDTGGTSTDAVVVTDAERPEVVRSAKAPTTHHDLTVGIRNAAAVACADIDAADISLVSVSTTLATNAIVEGRGGSVGLITMGFDEADLARVGFDDVIGAATGGFHLAVAGGHTSHGDEIAPLGLDELDRLLADVSMDRVSGVAVASMFAVRQPAHERAVRAHLRSRFEVGVTCSHELSSQLNGPKRALTAVLNARLLHLIGDLVAATRTTMAELGIDAPLMVVRGDGTLMAAEVAAERPVDTVLSGPAASIIGAHHLVGDDELDDEDEPERPVIVADIGGTTTDLAVAIGGQVAVDELGASVGGHSTMVPAVAVRTIGLGGDSEVHVDDDGPTTKLRIGPSRVIPLTALAATEPTVVEELRRQRRELEQWGRSPRLNGAFGVLRSSPPADDALDDHSRSIVEALRGGPVPLRELLPTRRHEVAAAALVRSGLVDRAAFTPTDAAHVLGLDDRMGSEAAELGAELLAATHDRRGQPVAASPKEAARAVLGAVTEQSASAILGLALERDGLPDDPSQPAIEAGVRHHRGLTEIDVRVAAPIVALGASAALHYPAVARRLGTELIASPHAPVANAIGAIVGRVRQVRSLTITHKKHRGYVVDGEVFDDLEQAASAATTQLTERVVELAIAAGAEQPTVTVERHDTVVDAEGGRVFVESVITAEASGRPRRRPSAMH